MVLIFLRHPTPDVPTGTCYGQTDLDIAEIGHEQIANAIKVTPHVKRVIASPALRCRKLAISIAERHDLTPTYDERLWEGESFQDVQNRVLEALQQADMETAIICHAGVIRATQMAWEGLTFEEVFKAMPPYAEPVRILPPEHQ